MAGRLLNYDYAVVKFLDGSDTVSEVPVSWLVDNNEYCLWPPVKNVAPYLTKCAKPEATWEKFKIKLESLCSKFCLF